jgi:hypothetical protein
VIISLWRISRIYVWVPLRKNHQQSMIHEQLHRVLEASALVSLHIRK